MSIRVTITDPDTGEVLEESETITDNYVLICDGTCELASSQVYSNGTHVLTVKNAKGKR